jgi:hypothetical protein
MWLPGIKRALWSLEMLRFRRYCRAGEKVHGARNQVLMVRKMKRSGMTWNFGSF